MYRVENIMGRLLGNEQLHESELLIAIGQRVRSRRRELGLSMAEVARASGISRVTLQRVEEGKASVSAGALASVSQAVGLPLGLGQQHLEQLPNKIRVGDFPGLVSLGWQIAPSTVLAPYEAWSMYARNWRHLDRAILSDDETQLLRLLERQFGGTSTV
jgi:transcriptional regulator with XRE-family HTH domain